jgi:hypothetical protein
VGANAQTGSNFSFNGMSQTPFFNDPGVRQQLGLNNNQFNQLNRAYQQSLLRYNQNLRTRDNSGVTNTVGGQQARQRNIRQGANGDATADVNQNTPGRDNTNVTNTVGGQQARQAEIRAGVDAGVRAGTDATSDRQGVATRRDLQANTAGDFDTALDSTFSDPAMRERFNQLNLQYRGVNAFDDPMVQQQLNLTPQQQQQFDRMIAEWNRDLANMQRSRRGNVTQDQFSDLRTRFTNRVNRVLTPEQQQQWTTMAGQAYDFPFSAYSTSSVTGSANAQAPGIQQQSDTSEHTIVVPKNSARGGVRQSQQSPRTR